MDATSQQGRRRLQGALSLYTLIVATVQVWLLQSPSPLGRPYLIFLGLCLCSSPWLALQGSHAARGIAGAITLIGTLMSAHISCAVFVPQTRLHGEIALLLFPVLSVLSYVFLFDPRVQAYITSTRLARGLPDSAWLLDPLPPGHERIS